MPNLQPLPDSSSKPVPALPVPALRIEVGGLQTGGKDYIIVSVQFGLQSGVCEYIERQATPDTVARQLEWLAHKVRSRAKS